MGLDTTNIPLISAKNGINIDQVLEAIVHKIPSPKGDINNPLQALIFDSYFDSYRGVIPTIRVKNGSLKKGDIIKMMASKQEYEIIDVYTNTPKEEKVDILSVGDVGSFSASIKDIETVRVGDTVTNKFNPAKEALPGYKILNPVVYCGLYPIDSKNYEDLKIALEKLKLNDASLIYEPETSQALGFGFRTGFLGLLHMDIIRERIIREFNIDIIATAPSVIFHVYLNDGTLIKLDNPSDMPDQQKIDKIEEPYIISNIITPKEYVGNVMDLCQKKRGIFKNMEYLDENRVLIHYELPLLEVVYDFFDKLKSMTKGYASFDYDYGSYKPSKLVKLDILLNGELVDALSVIVHKDFAYSRGRLIVEKLKDVIPRQMFEVPVQAVINNKVIARTDIKAVRKDVLAKCYGGDVSRKKKLLEKQKEGKKKMKQIGSVEVPQEAFLAILTNED